MSAQQLLLATDAAVSTTALIGAACNSAPFAIVNATFGVVRTCMSAVATPDAAQQQRRRTLYYSIYESDL